jgi:hypothetical protein
LYVFASFSFSNGRNLRFVSRTQILTGTRWIRSNMLDEFSIL